MLEDIKAAFEKLKREIEEMLGDDHAMHGRAEGVKAAVAHVDTTLATATTVPAFLAPANAEVTANPDAASAAEAASPAVPLPPAA